MKDLRNEIGGLFMVGLPGPELDDSTRSLVADYGIGNFIIFKRNVVGPDQLRILCRSLAAACREAGLPSPLISIDQEGGSVARLKAPFFTEFPDAAELAADPRAEELLSGYARTCADELLDLGITMNLAPVLDVCPAEEGLIMARRSLGANPGTVARLGSLVIRGMQGHGLAACAKHFPGLGAVRLDPHEALPRIDSSREQLVSSDLLPFREAIEAGVAAIMTSHTIYPALDPLRPATLSAPILSGLLRGELAYDGLLITDDLEMGAIETKGTVADAALAAFLAGADLLLICHEHPKIIAAHQALLAAVGKGVSLDRLEHSLRRIGQVRRRFVER